MEDREDWQAVSVETQDGGRVEAYWHSGDRGAVLLAHGRVYDAQSFEEYGNLLAQAGYGVMRLNFRGYHGSVPGGEGPGALYQDVLGCAGWVRDQGIDKVVALGASMGGGAVFRAAAHTPEVFRGLVGWSPVPIERELAQSLELPKLVLWSAEEAMAAALSFYYEDLAHPKERQVLPGAGHAQQIWNSPHRELLIDRTGRFLEAIL